MNDKNKSHVPKTKSESDCESNSNSKSKSESESASALNQKSRNHPVSPVDPAHAAELLRSGAVVAIPTETVYGLAARFDSESAIEKIFVTKRRPFFDPLILHIHDLSQIKMVVSEFPELAKKLAQEFWPGPLTMVLPKNENVNSKITAGLPDVGVRMPSHPIAQKIIQSVGVPLAAPSANLFKRTSPTHWTHVVNDFGSEVPVVDGGNCEIGIESTVIGFDSDFSQIFVYRPGVITISELSKFAKTTRKESPASPGQLQEHYMPRVPALAVRNDFQLSLSVYEQLSSQFNQKIKPIWLQLPDSPQQAARVLYQKLQSANESKGNLILLQLPQSFDENDENWMAVWDRVSKACQKI
jgi:L-threonylcarbamoyladenylate synthase